MDKKIEKAKFADFDLRVRRIAANLALEDYHLYVPEQMFSVVQNGARLILNLATLETPIMDIPADWWQHTKDRWYPAWLKKKFPVRKVTITAEHKLPELNLPESLLGREFVHLKLLNERRLTRDVSM